MDRGGPNLVGRWRGDQKSLMGHLFPWQPHCSWVNQKKLSRLTYWPNDDDFFHVNYNESHKSACKKWAKSTSRFKRTKFQAFAQLYSKFMLHLWLGCQESKFLLETRPWRQASFPGGSDVMTHFLASWHTSNDVHDVRKLVMTSGPPGNGVWRHKQVVHDNIMPRKRLYQGKSRYLVLST